ncbi:MAG: hypothetical protein M3Q65_24580 [Chloroflexota bacterium]|nr:hypothetical protein [Chloroflexota bacterium]
MATLSKLSYAPARREGQVYPSGARVTERRYLDLLVDGVALRELLRAQAEANLQGTPGGSEQAIPLAYITSFGWGPVWTQQDAAARLLTDLPPDLLNGRRSILVCPECGDAGCGVVSAVVEREGNVIVWRDFGYENDYDDDSLDMSDFAGLGRSASLCPTIALCSRG